jgi:hypothetical protein
MPPSFPFLIIQKMNCIFDLQNVLFFAEESQGEAAAT